jgi:hypothetical protein
MDNPWLRIPPPPRSQDDYGHPMTLKSNNICYINKPHGSFVQVDMTLHYTLRVGLPGNTFIKAWEVIGTVYQYLSLIISIHHGSSVLTVDHQYSSWITSTHHGPSVLIMDHHYSSWIITTHHGSTVLIMDQHYTFF